MQAYDVLKNSPFVVRFCDDVLVDRRPATQSLIDLYNAHGASVVILERVPKSKVSRFGVVDARKVKRSRSVDFRGQVYEIKKIVEKPLPEEAPSNLTIVGGYVVVPSTIRNLRDIADTLPPQIADDALPIAVALQIEIILGGRVYGWEFPGRRLDCGTLDNLKKTEKALTAGERGVWF